MENEDSKGRGDLGVCEGEKEEWSSSKTSKREDFLRSVDLSVNVQGFEVFSQELRLCQGFGVRGGQRPLGTL